MKRKKKTRIVEEKRFRLEASHSWFDAKKEEKKPGRKLKTDFLLKQKRRTHLRCTYTTMSRRREKKRKKKREKTETEEKDEKILLLLGVTKEE